MFLLFLPNHFSHFKSYFKKGMVPFSRQCKIWVLGVVINIGMSLLLDHFGRQSKETHKHICTYIYMSIHVFILKSMSLLSSIPLQYHRVPSSLHSLSICNFLSDDEKFGPHYPQYLIIGPLSLCITNTLASWATSFAPTPPQTQSCWLHQSTPSHAIRKW